MKLNQYTTLLNEDRLPYIVTENTFHKLESLDCSSPESVVKLVNSIYNADRLPYEEAYIVGLDSRNKAIGTYKVARGSIDAAALSTREIMMNLLLTNAAGCILIHNHPSGDPTPSSEDGSFSRLLRDACKLMNIRLQDSVIIGNDSYLSMRERGLI